VIDGEMIILSIEVIESEKSPHPKISLPIFEDASYTVLTKAVPVIVVPVGDKAVGLSVQLADPSSIGPYPKDPALVL